MATYAPLYRSTRLANQVSLILSNLPTKTCAPSLHYLVSKIANLVSKLLLLGNQASKLDDYMPSPYGFFIYLFLPY